MKQEASQMYMAGGARNKNENCEVLLKNSEL
jgi:hypothetical protein